MTMNGCKVCGAGDWWTCPRCEAAIKAEDAKRTRAAQRRKAFKEKKK